MVRVEKRLERWRRDRPKEMPLREVESTLQALGSVLRKKRGSHIVVSHEKLVGLSGYGLLGEFTIAVKRGEIVKGFYIQDILKAVEDIKQRIGDKEE